MALNPIPLNDGAILLHNNQRGGSMRALERQQDFSDELYRAALDTRKQRNKKRLKEAKKFSFLMNKDRYIKWERYKLKCLERGDEVNFQGVVTMFLDNLI